MNKYSVAVTYYTFLKTDSRLRIQNLNILTPTPLSSDCWNQVFSDNICNTHLDRFGDCIAVYNLSKCNQMTYNFTVISQTETTARSSYLNLVCSD
jgi:hypothetical protein